MSSLHTLPTCLLMLIVELLTWGDVGRLGLCHSRAAEATRTGMLARKRRWQEVDKVYRFLQTYQMDPDDPLDDDVCGVKFHPDYVRQGVDQCLVDHPDVFRSQREALMRLRHTADHVTRERSRSSTDRARNAFRYG